ncbi:MAG: hypothetical protein IJ983_00580, partial [Kiritimatiellae bacterium]|nr:hypothetical protein [Kiritimatiellia bacterium]
AASMFLAASMLRFLDPPSYVDGIGEYVPGITPYRWNYGMPAKAVELVYGGDKALATKLPGYWLLP